MIADFSTTSTYMIGKLEILHVFLFNCISGSTDLNIDRFVTFVSHDRSRSQNPALMLKLAYCKTITFQASFFWSDCKTLEYYLQTSYFRQFFSLSIFKNYPRATYFSLLDTTFQWYWHALSLVPLSQLPVPPFIIYTLITVFCAFLLDFNV